ncbi:MAG: RNA polymerase factor sigma-54 [Gemmatimonadales bacterium]|nr:RNA polymerase factor sigma-54 [Gemmatimonadales bacterium]NIN11638.1 RNA polymerase factor sigma-54 [Gemmatimonadales bacterium]NIN50244.1 RNA polymerase factor sigma-54 [Gemmatimonadales bacterium]NIP07708.1 RNA polymerase factor sigma-54 [Gemmatimonadales bacterium]NIR01860.1 RNA polymerase factor sigma-54 [Gemmatimonadales bacterium]
MKTSLQQSPILKQELRMNPRLYQAMDLLYMPLLDLQQHLKAELETNPFLELAEGEETDSVEEREAEQSEADRDEEVDWEEIILDGLGGGGARAQYEEREYYQPVAVEVRDLADHLRDQLQLLDLEERQLFLSEEFIGNIGDDGYLGATLEDIVSGANARRQEALAAEGKGAAPDPALADPFTLAEAEALLEVMQQLDPPGIAARDLRECLLLQLKEAAHEGMLAYRLVDEAFEDLIAHRWTELAKRYGVDPKDVQAAADELAVLDPKPGLQFAGVGGEYVIPDLVVEHIDDQYRVFLNDGGMPRLRISQVYKNIAADKKKFVGESREFITQKLNSATWLVQAIEQRRQTMLKVMHFIIDQQRDFFARGVEHLKPLTLREVAEVLDMHESTVSRVTSQKYVQTPRGVYPLKFFFSSSLGTTTGEEASSRAVKAQIGKLVAEEDPANPLTDAAIVSALKQRGVQIARRTVAKYREQLAILPARMRKRV